MEIKKFLGISYESNVYLIKTQAICILIDTGTGFYSKQLIDNIEKNILLDNIDKIILTHEHYDHCGGIDLLKTITNATIYAHEMTAEVIEKGLNWSASFFNAEQPCVTVEKKLRDSDKIEIDGTSFDIIHTPGHSNGSICIYEKTTKSLFSGDTIFSNGDVGRTDFYGGSVEKLQLSIKKIAALEISNLYPGHGPYILKHGKSHVLKANHFVSCLSGNLLK